jgi:hypothetical protein
MKVKMEVSRAMFLPKFILEELLKGTNNSTVVPIIGIKI